MRETFRWLEKAVIYLDGLKPPIDHRFDLGHGLVFESPRFGRGSVGQHERRIVGYPVLDEINLYYVIAAAKPLTVTVAPGGAASVEKTLDDDSGLQYASRRTKAADGTVRICAISIPPEVPAAVSSRVDYQTSLLAVVLAVGRILVRENAIGDAHFIDVGVRGDAQQIGMLRFPAEAPDARLAGRGIEYRRYLAGYAIGLGPLRFCTMRLSGIASLRSRPATGSWGHAS